MGVPTRRVGPVLVIVCVSGASSQPFPVVGRLDGALRRPVLPEPKGDPPRHGEDVRMGNAAHRGARAFTSFGSKRRHDMPEKEYLCICTKRVTCCF